VKGSRLALAVAFGAIVAIGRDDDAQRAPVRRAPNRARRSADLGERGADLRGEVRRLPYPGGIAPFSLLSAKSAKAHANGILVMTKLGGCRRGCRATTRRTTSGQSQRI
jgi:hypothetical protein